VVSSEGDVAVLNATSGKRKWRTKVSGQPLTHCAFARGVDRLVVSSTFHFVVQKKEVAAKLSGHAVCFTHPLRGVRSPHETQRRSLQRTSCTAHTTSRACITAMHALLHTPRQPAYQGAMTNNTSMPVLLLNTSVENAGITPSSRPATAIALRARLRTPKHAQHACRRQSAAVR
jgi:hypothetical protein